MDDVRVKKDEMEDEARVWPDRSTVRSVKKIWVVKVERSEQRGEF